MKRITFLAFLILTAVWIAACGSSTGDNHSGAGHGDTEQESGHGGHGSGKADHEDGHGEHQADSAKASIHFVEGKATANQDVTIQISVQDQSGTPIEKFDINHEKLLHLILVSKDLSYFAHLHPEYKGKGLFEVKTRFPFGGEYKWFADFIPAGSSAMTKSDWVKVDGQSRTPEKLDPDGPFTKTVEGKRVTLAVKHLHPNEDVTLTFSFKDAKTDKPITNLQPYLGAAGHVVIISEDAEQYLHVHPLDEKSAGPDAKFVTNFPKSGVYKIWGQFQHEQKVFTVPFVVQVP